MKKSSLGSWIIVGLGALYFLVPLLATFEFSLRLKRGEYSFEAYSIVLADPLFQSAFIYSMILALVTIVIGYVRMYNTSSFLPLTQTVLGTDTLLSFGYVALSLPYMYRAVETGLRTIDVATLTEAAESLGASLPSIMVKVILPNIKSAILSGAFLTFATVIGEFTFASLLNRPTFGPYLQLIGAKRAYEPAALAIIAFAITWACMGLLQLAGSSGRKAAGGK